MMLNLECLLDFRNNTPKFILILYIQSLLLFYNLNECNITGIESQWLENIFPVYKLYNIVLTFKI